MIFVTVGTQLPFERLIKAVDKWAALHPEQEVVAQIGDTKYQPKHMKVVERVDPSTYAQYFNSADVIISHVGMGTIISGLEGSKQLVLMPRLAKLGEHRNDHQLGTASRFSHFSNISIVDSESELNEAIDRSLVESNRNFEKASGVSVELTDALRAFAQQMKGVD